MNNQKKIGIYSFADSRSYQKTISSSIFLYFSILSTAIALGMLNDVKKKLDKKSVD